ncbi:nitroreductase family deazaflavin-dependent oxidoreductase [Streptomyces sp. KL118A]|uniref:nitroreductase family deazaflavin-dependent oxidoreductase n=1 Tax=Streptomyces sp. KL118A TaxID=3045153 RepID=UPI00278BBD6F|nr:nitroreductase family deazaflavin-dependent oxidoreductase [Streptomyces sp. KL118A]
MPDTTARPAAAAPDQRVRTPAAGAKRPSRAVIRINRAIVATNVWIYRRSSGKVLGKFGRLDALLLTTQGRKSGKRRTNPVGYLYDNGRFIVLAAYGGNAVHPGWYHNLRTNPAVTVEIGAETIRCTAALQKSGAERDRLWKALTDVFPTFLKFQDKTERLLPIVVLTPDDLDPQEL